MGKCETRTQEALVAALRGRPRTPYRAAQCVLGAKASLFSSLLERDATADGRLRAMSARDHTCDPAVVFRAPGGLLSELRAVDHAVYAAVAVTRTPGLDVPIRRLSTAADYSRLWFAIAGLLALVGGGPDGGRRSREQPP